MFFFSESSNGKINVWQILFKSAGTNGQFVLASLWQPEQMQIISGEGKEFTFTNGDKYRGFLELKTKPSLEDLLRFCALLRDNPGPKSKIPPPSKATTGEPSPNP